MVFTSVCNWTLFYATKIQAGFEVLTRMGMKSSIFWDIEPCRPLKPTDVSEEYFASTFRVEE
jgi:hypothetical protein